MKLALKVMAGCVSVCALGARAGAATAGTLDTVKGKGMLTCGVSTGVAGYSLPDDKGQWTGLDVDVCRAVATAVFGDATKVKFVALDAKNRFTALQSGEIDMLSRETTWTSSRESTLAFTDDTSGLYAERVRLSNPDDNVILPEVISKEPLAPVVRQGDDQWFDVLRWSVYSMINAEELGVTSKNVDDMKKSDNPNIKRMLGTEGDQGKALGLSNEWAYNIIKQLGNYGEMFDRNVGEGSPLKIKRGLNALWNKGGIQYAPPIR